MDGGDTRQQLGQWFTPPAVADLVLALTGARPGQCVLDPTCGDGVFLARAELRGLGGRGGDVDERAVASARARCPKARIDEVSLFDLDPDEVSADHVVGNPPYVRPERVDETTRSAAARALKSDWPVGLGAGLGERADLAALCLPRMLRMTRPGGRLAVVVSSALFDAGYSRALWPLLLAEASPVAIVDAPGERWFADAAVNTCIVVLERGAPKRRFPVARLRVPTAEAALRVHGPEDLSSVAEVLLADPEAPESWGRLRRAPAIWFDIERLARGGLAPLGELASLSRGTTSGANEVFYLERSRARSLSLEDHGLVPLLRSPREPGGDVIEVDAQGTPWVAVVVSAEVDPPAKIADYFAAHAADCEQRPTLRARKPWWALPARPAHLFLTKAYADRFVQRQSHIGVVADQRYYPVAPRPGVDRAVLAAVLNSTWTALALESLGRASLGEGALEWTVADAKHLPVIDPRRLDRDAVLRAFEPLRRRPIGTVAEERTREDRRLFDLAVAGAVPGLVDRLDDAHAGLCQSAAQRCSRPQAPLSP